MRCWPRAALRPPAARSQSLAKRPLLPCAGLPTQRLDLSCHGVTLAAKTSQAAPQHATASDRLCALRLCRRAMAAGQPQVVVAFAQALTELVTVEKKNIVLLTEIARDALRTDPAAAPGLAALISTRILQVGPGA